MLNAKAVRICACGATLAAAASGAHADALPDLRTALLDGTPILNAQKS